MKKTCLALLAAAALPAFAALDIASVDIEGITLGMNEKESAAIVKAYCEKEKDGKYEELPMPINEINFNASICSLNDFAAFSLDSNTVLVGIEQKINLDNINDKDFIKNWQLAVQEKAIQKYGKTVLEKDNAAVFLNGREGETFRHILCWGECEIRNSESETNILVPKYESEPDKSVLEAKGKAFFVGLDVKGSKATIIRMLIDETAINAAQKNAPKTEAEKAAAKVNL